MIKCVLLMNVANLKWKHYVVNITEQKELWADVLEL
jgi:hypothetical protein